jgi:hypothetical protein
LFNGCALYHFKNPLILEQISINTNGIIRNKPYYEIITEGKSLDDIKRQLEEYREYSKRKIISPYEYQDLKGEVIMYLNSQKNVLDDFHSSTRELKESIVKKMVLKP